MSPVGPVQTAAPRITVLASRMGSFIGLGETVSTDERHDSRATVPLPANAEVLVASRARRYRNRREWVAVGIGAPAARLVDCAAASRAPGSLLGWTSAGVWRGRRCLGVEWCSAVAGLCGWYA
jgi:hypothetical protein